MAVFLGADVFSPLSCLMAADTTGGLTSDTKQKEDCYHQVDDLTNQATERNISDKLLKDMFNSSFGQLTQVSYLINDKM